MYRLLIVDDERYLVESIYELISAQSELDLDILTCCYSDEAMQIINSQRIDLILLDINMPGKTGLEIADELAEIWPSCQIIFLTGYADFDYIYRSSKLKNATFLLKTEDNDTILKAVRDAISQLDFETEHRKLLSKEHSRDLYVNYLLYRDPLKKMLLGQHISLFTEIVSFLPSSFAFDLKRDFFLLLLKLPGEQAAFSYAEDPQFITSTLKELSARLDDRFEVFICPIDPSLWAVFLQPSATLKKSADAMLLYIKEALNFDGNSSLFDKLSPIFILVDTALCWEQIGCVYAQLSATLDEFLFERSAQIGQYFFICPDRQKNVDSSKKYTVTLPDLASSLRFGLNAKDPVHIKKALADANDFWSKHASMHKLGAIHLYHELSNVFIEYILQHDLEKSLAFRTGLFRLYHIDQFDNWGQVFDYFNSIADAILSLSVNAEQNSRHQTLQRIKDYIQANLNRNLTLNEIASSVCYNSSHVSRFFHQMTGQTISQYILQQRMEEACRCLSCENDSIQAISEHLGFDSAQYFSNVFKKYTGVSPRDYRNGIRS